MSLTRWIPRSSLASYHNELDRFFDSFFRPTYEEESSLSAFKPAVDIEENDKEFNVTAELPGIKKEDVKVSIKDNLLSISGEKKQETKVKEKNYNRTERIFGSFQRCFRLPEMVNQDNISAEFKDGILNIAIPKLKEAVSKQIEIKVK